MGLVLVHMDRAAYGAGPFALCHPALAPTGQTKEIDMTRIKAKIADTQKGEVISVSYKYFTTEEAMQRYVNAIPGDSLVILKYEKVVWDVAA